MASGYIINVNSSKIAYSYVCGTASGGSHLEDTIVNSSYVLFFYVFPVLILSAVCHKIRLGNHRVHSKQLGGGGLMRKLVVVGGILQY